MAEMVGAEESESWEEAAEGAPMRRVGGGEGEAGLGDGEAGRAAGRTRRLGSTGLREEQLTHLLTYFLRNLTQPRPVPRKAGVWACWAALKGLSRGAEVGEKCLRGLLAEASRDPEAAECGYGELLRLPYALVHEPKVDAGELEGALAAVRDAWARAWRSAQGRPATLPDLACFWVEQMLGGGEEGAGEELVGAVEGAGRALDGLPVPRGSRDALALPAGGGAEGWGPGLSPASSSSSASGAPGRLAPASAASSAMDE